MIWRRGLGTNGLTFKSFNFHNQITKELSLNIERSNACMKCGNPFTIGHLKVCPATDITCKNCNYKEPFSKKFWKSGIKRPSVNIVNDNHLNTEQCICVPSESSWSKNQEMCRVISAWNENGQNDYSWLHCYNNLRQKRTPGHLSLNIVLG